MHSIAIALSAFRRHQAVADLGHYTGVLTLQGFCRVAVQQHDAALLDEARALCRQFMAREITLRFCNYENYRCGGNGTAYLLRHGELPDAAEQVREFAEQLVREAPKNRDGLVCHPKEPDLERVFIDQAFAVCPFMLSAGLALNEPAYLDEACKQGWGMIDLLRDETCGLLHQGVNFDGRAASRRIIGAGATAGASWRWPSWSTACPTFIRSGPGSSHGSSAWSTPVSPSRTSRGCSTRSSRSTTRMSRPRARA